MNSTAPDIDKVTALLHEITHRLVLPRFSRLERREIEPKSTAGNLDDIVTIVDHQVEEQISGCAAVEYTAY